MSREQKKYLWEIIQDEVNIDLEISRRCGINEVIEKNKIDISHRFSKEFKEYLKYKILMEEEGYPQDSFKEIENLFLKMLGTLDLIRGTNKKRYIKNLILKEISNIINIDVFNNEEKEIIALYYYEMKKIGDETEIFKKALQKIFKNIEFYFVKEKILLYISAEKKSDNEKKVEVLIELFLNINYPIRIFWNNYFGVIGQNRMMILDKIEIY